MKIIMRDGLLTGNDLIDSQHKKIYDVINNLLAAARRGEGRTEIVKTAAFLKSYVVDHFRDEEKLLLDSKYPDYEAHKKEHEGFLVEFNKLSMDLEKEGPNHSLVINALNMAVNWVGGHIEIYDLALSKYLHQQTKTVAH